MANEVEKYLDVHPFRPWDQNAWDERSTIIDTAFHATDVYFTPLIGNSMIMPVGVGWDDYWHVGAEIVQSHTNHEPIGRYQRMMGPIYVDTRKRKVRARYRYACKWQMDEMDEMITRYGNDTPQFITRVLDAQLADQVVSIHEKVARDGYLTNCLFNYMGYDGNAWSLGTYDWSTIQASAAYTFDITLLEESALRMSYRVEDTLHKWGNYAQPVPGGNFRGSVLVMVTTGVFWELWNSEAQEWMIDLRQLQDGRILNGGNVVQYRNMTIQDTGHAMVLWNCGNIGTQVAVTSPILWGDGAPDPVTTAVDSTWYTGQSPATATHSVACSNFGATDFVAGDFVTIHTSQTSTYGITGGVNPYHGKTMRAEVYSFDATANTLTFRKPITEEYREAFQYTNLNGAAAAGQAYAIITKAQHIHPVIVVGAREALQFVNRRHADGTVLQYNRPADTVVDFPSVERVTVNWFGEMNVWNLDIYEVYYVAGAFANRGGKSY